MAGPPNGDRANAALVVTLVLLIGGFVCFLSILLRPASLGVIDDRATLAVLSAFGGIMAGVSLALRYWFPSEPRSRRGDDSEGN